jgi:hypothetical protein
MDDTIGLLLKIKKYKKPHYFYKYIKTYKLINALIGKKILDE